MLRIGQVINLPPENLEAYTHLHDNIWPEVAQIIAECNIRNYSIYYLNGQLFAYMEYIGEDFDADMAKMAADENTQKWWDVCKPLQQPDSARPQGAWWWDAKEVFHQD
ncbi:MAG: L-rhamnose mutarotase [Ruthenibacterium sp.]